MTGSLTMYIYNTYYLHACTLRLMHSVHIVLGRVRPASTAFSHFSPNIDAISSSRATLTMSVRYLEREYLINYPKAHIVLLRPSMSFMLMQTPDPLTLKDALPDFSKTTHIFLPINDCRNVEVAEGGSHWSLLLVSLNDGVSFHYDSLWPSNSREAELASRKIGQLLGGKSLQYVDLEDSPQQENSSDCGVFVCVQMKHLLLGRLLRANAQEKISMSMRGKKVDARAGRKEMLKIIEEFRKEGERRRS